ncbi:hypothetical protein K474DRAFT_461370 [Panus rudis PR-1116 ss-1]|nr:hypothetical protein K474DRAFT_461370 [Panus rudis PR-1116 ss-1]
MRFLRCSPYVTLSPPGGLVATSHYTSRCSAHPSARCALTSIPLSASFEMSQQLGVTEGEHVGVALQDSNDVSAAATNPAGLSPEAALMTTLVREVRDFDEGKIKGVKEDLETLLTFAGLFSAALTAFTVESYKQLQPDANNTAVFLLATIARQLNNSMVEESLSQQFQPALVSASSKQLNGLWFSSLFLSLVTASMAMLAKQWLREFLSLNDAPSKFLHRHRGLTVYRVFEITAFLPLFLQLALVLFFIGLSIFVRSLDTHIGWAITTLVVIWLMLYAIALFLPAFSYSCPYKTPMVAHLRQFIVRRIVGSLITLVCWALKGLHWLFRSIGWGYSSVLYGTANFLEKMKDLLISRKANSDEEMAMYSILTVKHQLPNLALEGREAEICRLLASMVPELTSCDPILGWVGFMGGMKNIPPQFRPQIRLSIAEASDDSSPVSDWGRRLAVIFEDVTDLEDDRQALQDILQYLPLRFRMCNDKTRTHMLIEGATTCAAVSPDDIFRLTRSLGGMEQVPPHLRPLVRKCLAKDPITDSDPGWHEKVTLIFESARLTEFATIMTEALPNLPGSLESYENVMEYVRIVGGMANFPIRLRPIVRRCIMAKPAHDEGSSWDGRLNLVFHHLSPYDKSHIGDILSDALTWLRTNTHLSTNHVNMFLITCAQRMEFLMLCDDIHLGVTLQDINILLATTSSKLMRAETRSTALKYLTSILYLVIHAKDDVRELAWKPICSYFDCCTELMRSPGTTFAISDFEARAQAKMVDELLQRLEVRLQGHCDSTSIENLRQALQP